MTKSLWGAGAEYVHGREEPSKAFGAWVNWYDCVGEIGIGINSL